MKTDPSPAFKLQLNYAQGCPNYYVFDQVMTAAASCPANVRIKYIKVLPTLYFQLLSGFRVRTIEGFSHED